jgi:mono/diheme cytochrome c family protein
MFKFIFFFLLLGISPAFGQYRVVHNANVQQLVIPQRVVQFDERYFLGHEGYYAVGDKLRAEKEQEKVEDNNFALTEAQKQVEFYKGQVDMLLKIHAASGGKKLDIPNVTPNIPVPPVPEEPAVEEDSGYDGEVLKIVNAKCARCHGENKADAGISLVKNAKLQYNNDSLEDWKMRSKIFDLVYGANLKERGLAQMPKGGSLSDEEVEYIRLWMVSKAY